MSRKKRTDDSGSWDIRFEASQESLSTLAERARAQLKAGRCTPLDFDADKLRRVIERSGLSARQFAMQVLLRDERTIRRWLAGDSPIPEPVASRLDDWLAGKAS